MMHSIPRHEAWGAAEPGQGYDAKGAECPEKLAATGEPKEVTEAAASMETGEEQP